MVAQKHYIRSDITVVMHPGAPIAAKASGSAPWCCPLGAVPPAKPGWTFDAGPVWHAGRSDQALAALRAVGLADPSEQAGTETMAKSPANRAKAHHSTEPKSPEGKDLAKPYEQTPEERVAVEAMGARIKELPVAPRLKVSEKGGAAQILPDHPDFAVGHILLMEAIGTVELDFLNGILKQLANAGSQGKSVDESGLNFMLAVVKGVEPKDQVEAMLAAQMATVHMATMKFARRLNHVENLPQQDSAERAFNKLARTFAAQVEALRRHRTGGEQKVTVEHVTVNEGGQAIVGSVAHGPGGGRATKNSKATS